MSKRYSEFQNKYISQNKSLLWQRFKNRHLTISAKRKSFEMHLAWKLHEFFFVKSNSFLPFIRVDSYLSYFELNL